MLYKTSASEIEQWVVGAEDWWPHLRTMLLFWVACVGTAVILFLDYHFGYSRFGWSGAIILGTLFAMADIALPAAALKHEVDDENDFLNMSLVVLCTIMSMIVVIGSTAEISTVSSARNDVGKIDYDDTTRQILAKQKERDAIPVDRGAQALSDLADANEKASEREKDRVRCGTKCEELKKQAADYRSRAKEAARKDTLTGEIEALKARLAGGGNNTLRSDVDPLAVGVEAMTFGMISQQGVRRFFLTVVGLVLTVLLTLTWMKVGRDLKKEIAWELNHRGEIANEALATIGRPSKYGVPVETKALPAPTTRTDAAADPTLNITVQVADMRKRFANDADLLETDSLFEKLMLKGEGGHVTIAAVYRAYQVMVLTSDPDSRYMTQKTLAEKISTIARNRDDVKVTADGRIEGWVLKPASSRNTEVTANA
jgi:hypothetical protein